jgi:hypothetical protein
VSAIASVLLVSCASPLVKYKPISSQDQEGWAKFRLAESLVKFDYGKLPSGLANENDIVIASVPIPHGQNRYGIGGTRFWENWGVSTTVNVSYRGDSDLIQQVSILVVDQRQQAIQAAGGTIASLGGLLALGTAAPKTFKLPKGISVSSLLASPPGRCSRSAETAERDQTITCVDLELEGTSDFKADVEVGPVPKDAIDASYLSEGRTSANFYYAACRSMTITLKARQAARSDVSATVSVADPRYLQALRFPEKGTITVAPSCGANSLYQDAGLPTALDYLNSLAAQAKAIKQAFDKAKSSGAK